MVDECAVGRAAGSVVHTFASVLMHQFGLSARDVAMFLSLEGVAGAWPRSLRVTGADSGLSAERVRRLTNTIRSKYVQDLAAKPVGADLRTKTYDFLSAAEQAAPMLVSEREAPRPLKSIVSGEWRRAKDISEFIPSALRVAMLLGIGGSLIIDDWRGRSAILSSYTPRCYESLLWLARKICQSSGAVGVGLLSAQFAALNGINIDPAVTRLALGSASSLLCEDSDDVWFTFDGPNEVLGRAAKAVATIGHYPVLAQHSEVGLYESRSAYRIAPPYSVIVRLLESVGYEVVAGLATATNIESDGVSPIQKTMVGILQDHGGKAPRHEFIAMCEQHGIKPTTARIYLTRSGLFAREANLVTLA